MPAVPYAITVQPDGKIVAAGIGFPRTDGDFVLWRLLADGQPDPEFGTDGRVLTDFSGHSEQVRTLIVQLPDGRILVTGSVLGAPEVPRDARVVRYLGPPLAVNPPAGRARRRRQRPDLHDHDHLSGYGGRRFQRDGDGAGPEESGEEVAGDQEPGCTST
jgi:uncharacterized delta-60 repeat protein